MTVTSCPAITVVLSRGVEGLVIDEDPDGSGLYAYPSGSFIETPAGSMLFAPAPGVALIESPAGSMLFELSTASSFITRTVIYDGACRDT